MLFNHFRILGAGERGSRRIKPSCFPELFYPGWGTDRRASNYNMSLSHVTGRSEAPPFREFGCSEKSRTRRRRLSLSEGERKEALTNQQGYETRGGGPVRCPQWESCRDTGRMRGGPGSREERIPGALLEGCPGGSQLMEARGPGGHIKKQCECRTKEKAFGIVWS